MSDTTALRHVLDGYRADIARRSALIRTHTEAAAELQAANAIDTAQAEVAEALIAQLRADESTAWAPAQDIEAAALVASAFLPGGMAEWGKTQSRAALLAALHDAEADIAALDGVQAAALVHDHRVADCPACLLSGAGDLAALDGISTGSGVAR